VNPLVGSIEGVGAVESELSYGDASRALGERRSQG